jgi:hypothetical protein
VPPSPSATARAARRTSGGAAAGGGTPVGAAAGGGSPAGVLPSPGSPARRHSPLARFAARAVGAVRASPRLSPVRAAQLAEEEMVDIGPDAGDVDVLDDDNYAYLMSLSLDSFDTPYFHILPVMVIFAAQGGANPEWLKHCHSSKMMAYTTLDGWMDEEAKLKWYMQVRRDAFPALSLAHAPVLLVTLAPLSPRPRLARPLPLCP